MMRNLRVFTRSRTGAVASIALLLLLIGIPMVYAAPGFASLDVPAVSRRDNPTPTQMPTFTASPTFVASMTATPSESADRKSVV